MRHILEDPATLQAAMEAEIRSTLASSRNMPSGLPRYAAGEQKQGPLVEDSHSWSQGPWLCALLALKSIFAGDQCTGHPPAVPLQNKSRMQQKETGNNLRCYDKV